MDSSTLGRAVQTLCRIDNAGLLDEFLLDVAEASRGPADDLDRHPEWRYTVARLSRIACQLFRVPAGMAKEAAIQSLVPSTRESITMVMLDQYEERLDEQALKAQAQRKLRTFNNRRGA